MSNRAMLARVEVAPLLGLKEFGSYRKGWTVPPQSSKEVSTARLLPDPTIRSNVRSVFLKVKPIPAFRDTFIAL